jgi:hypothetical protein
MPQTYEDCLAWATLFLRTRVQVARFYEGADGRDFELMLWAARVRRWPAHWAAVKGSLACVGEDGDIIQVSGMLPSKSW